MKTAMSLERIDEYMKQLKAVTDYDRVCKQLQKAREEWAKEHQINYFNSLIIDSLVSRFDELQKELREKGEIVSSCNSIIEKQKSYITLIENVLQEARHPQPTDKELARFKGFVALDVTVDDFTTVLKRKMNAIYF